MRRNMGLCLRWGDTRSRGRNREGPSHPAVGTNAGAEVAGDRNPKKRRGGVSCGAAHSQAREMVTQGYTATLVAATLAISRSSLYYRKRPRGSRADRTYDEQIVMACGEKLAYGYRRVAWWLQRKKGLPVNRKRVLRVMRERGLLVRSRRLRARRKKEWGPVETAEPNQIWQSDMTKIWAGSAAGWAYLVCVIDCCTREIVGWNLSHRCRTEDALAAVEQAVLERLPQGSREARLTMTTDNGTQFTSSRFLETLGRLGITHRRTAYHHPEGNSYIERFHRSLKEEEVWTAEYRSLEEARASIARWIEEYNHDRPHRGVGNRTPHEAFLSFAAVLNSEALTV
jgi:putative transposase